MTSLAVDAQLPVSADDRARVIDAVNRLNLAFDEWDVEAMVAAFTEDGIVHHARGDIAGHQALRRFYDDYRPLTLGVRRHALNHVVDRQPDGTLRVRSYNMLVRVAPPGSHARLEHESVSEFDGLPAIYIHAVMTDIFRHDEGIGWRICRRTAEGNSLNGALRA